MAATVSAGADRFGQWPVARSLTSVLPGIWACTYWPTKSVRSGHRSTAGPASAVSPGQVGAIVGEKGGSRETLAISGSVRQKLAVSSAPSSGRSALPMITGAMVLDQPR